MPFSTLQFLSADATTSTAAVAAAGGTSYTLLSATTTINRLASQAFYVNLTAATTATLPASPSDGDSIIFATVSSMVSFNLTVARNGKTIAGLAEDLIIDQNNTRTELVYYNGDWKVYITT